MVPLYHGVISNLINRDKLLLHSESTGSITRLCMPGDSPERENPPGKVPACIQKQTIDYCTMYTNLSALSKKIAITVYTRNLSLGGKHYKRLRKKLAKITLRKGYQPCSQARVSSRHLRRGSKINVQTRRGELQQCLYSLIQILRRGLCMHV